jgi:adenylate cyclase class 2
VRAGEVLLATETEIKVKISGAEDFLLRLKALQPRAVSERHFEDNYLLDFKDQSLRESRSLMRVRCAQGRALLTYKGPPAAGGIFRSLEEIETGADSGIHALEIFRRLGLRVWFRYQKYRREYGVDSVVVAVDETPIGDYAELEGSEAGILALAQRLGFDVSEFIRHNYYALYVEACRTRGMKPGNMVFDPE